MELRTAVLGALAILIAVSIARRPSLPQREQAQTVLVETTNGWGSAVTIKRGGLCFAWTAAHVVDDYAKVKVHRILRYHNRKAGDFVCEARVLKVFPNQDAALLLIDGDPAMFQDATFSRVPGVPGDVITHVGNILGPRFDTSFESGVVSQTGVKHDSENCSLDQANLCVAPGCSGGPVFNTHGDVIGLVVIYVGPGIGLYVPVRVLEAAAESENLDWALRGYFHAPVRELVELATAREKEVAAKAPPDILQFIFGAPTENK